MGGVLRPSQPDSAGSQFFICLKRSPQLDEKYAAFAQVTGDLEVLEKIALAPTDDLKSSQKRIGIRRFRLTSN